MNTISLNSERKFSATVVPNLFIDRFMPSANGSYVKVYLYLLRCLSGAAKPFTLSTAADALDETEKDIIRALSYWEKNNVVSLVKEENTLTGITLLDLKATKVLIPLEYAMSTNLWLITPSKITVSASGLSFFNSS